MKKITLLSLVLSLVLAGCFSDSSPSATDGSKEDAPKEVSVSIDSNQATVIPVSVNNQAVAVETIPAVTPEEKIADADLYKKAFEAKNPALCADISSDSLKKVCVTETHKK